MGPTTIQYKDFLRITIGKKIKETILKNGLFVSNSMILLLLINVLAYNFGIHNSNIYRLTGFLIMILFLIINLPFKDLYRIVLHRRKESLRLVLLGGLLLVISVMLLFSFSNKELWVLQVPLFILGVDVLLKAVQKQKKEFLFYSSLAFIYGLIVLIIQNSPPLYYVIKQISLGFSTGIGNLSQPIVLSASASGFWIFLSFVVFISLLFFISSKKKQQIFGLLAAFIALLICWILYIIFQGYSTFQAIPDRMNTPYLLFIFCSVVLVVYILRKKTLFQTKPSINTTGQRPLLDRFKLRIPLICILLVCSVLLMTVFFVSPSSSKPTVSIYQPGIDVGGLDVPEYGRYGRYASGFFGLLPEYLESFGYQVMVINESITEENLASIDVLIIINLGEMLSDETVAMIWTYVDNGGSLLVMGDHTDIGGIMNPLNDLLEPVGISFRFDSALPIKSRWASCYNLLHHPVTEGLQNSHDIDVSVGASLDIDVTKHAFSVIIGKGGFSDIGSYLNVDRSYLGDYDVNPGEQIGDVILAAGAYYGQGRVLVFGDTSSFQNLALSTSYPLVSNCFTWLTRGETAVMYYLKIGGSLLLLGLALYLIAQSKKQTYFVLYPLVVCVTVVCSSLVNPLLLGDLQPEGPTVYIDYSHGERINREYYEDASASGLMLNLIRNEYVDTNRYLPYAIDDFEKYALTCKILVLIAPTRPFNQEEVADIDHFMSTGGLLLLSVGYNDKSGSQALLDRFGFDILPSPLGPVPYVDENPNASQNEPRFVDSWPIIIKDSSATQIFYSIDFGGEVYPLVVFKQHGTGGILLIGDSQFLLDENIETLYEYWPGNIEFIKSIMEELRKEGVPQ